jgi:hypothetical protein
MGEGRDFVDRVPFNKGKNVVDDPKMAAIYFSPKKLFMKHEMEQYRETPASKHATLHERQKHRKFLKDQFHCLPPDILEVYKKVTREKMALHGYIEEAIVNTLNDNCEQSYRALSKHVSGWCSYQTIERWLKSHESYASYAKNIKPGLTEGNRVKQVIFSQRVQNRWGLPPHSTILWCMSDEKWWFGLIARTFAKMCPELGVEKNLSPPTISPTSIRSIPPLVSNRVITHVVNALPTQTQVMGHATVGYLFYDTPENGERLF